MSEKAEESAGGREKKIRVLDFEVANLIAAGEVVDRPASVIKELTENAIDSGATVITIEIKHGGVTYMRVTDNGCGIAFDELPTAILRHATSKIRDAGDLERIGTLGFRGEALAAIAAVSRMRILSRPKDSEMGGLLAAEGGRVTEHAEVGCSAGTTVIVEELFSNVPARRKFLKKDSAEAAAVVTVAERIALSRPDISFRLINGGEMKLRTEGNGDLASAVYSVLGRDFYSRAIHVFSESGGIRVSGFIGMPDTARANRNGEIFFINGRYVRSKTAGAAVEEAFRTYIPDDRFPSCVLSVEISPEAVDVNVHPAKLEVKFSNEKPVFEAVFYACRPALLRGMTTGTLSVPSGSSYGGKANGAGAGAACSGIAGTGINAGGGVGDKNTYGGYAEYLRRAAFTKSAFAPSGGRAAEKNIPLPVKNGSGPRADFDDKSRADFDNGTRAGFDDKSRTDFDNASRTYFDDEPRAVLGGTSPRAAGEPTLNAAHTGDESGAVTARLPWTDVPEAEFSDGAPPQTNVPAPEREAEIPDYTILGEAWDCYVVVTVGDRLLLIDKHAAHERILFEELRRNMRRDKSLSASQLLLVPVTVSLTETEAENVASYRAEIERAGFAFSQNGRQATVTALPSGIVPDAVPAIFETFGSELYASPEDVRDEIFERALYTTACKAAIKGGRRYGPEHIKWLCDELFRLPDIKYCPHGRPVSLEMTRSALDRRFGRTE